MERGVLCCRKPSGTPAQVVTAQCETSEFLWREATTGVMSFSGWYSSHREARSNLPPAPTTHTPGTHVPSWLKYSDHGFSGPLPLPIPGTLALAFWLISSVGKISSACLRFRFNWPCMSFSLPDFQSIQDLIIKEPPCSTRPGGSIFSGEGCG